MSACAERLAGVDPDCSNPGSGGAQGGPIQSDPTVTGSWKRFHASSQPGGTSSILTSPKLSRRRSAPASSVYATSSTSSRPALLGKALGMKLEHACRRLFDPIAGHDDRRADEAQRKALLSFSKKPSSDAIGLLGGGTLELAEQGALLIA